MDSYQEGSLLMASPAVTVHEATVETPERLETLLQLYLEIFPDDSRYVPYIRECAERALEDDPKAAIHQWVVEYDGKSVGLRLFNYLKQRNVAFGRYFGLLPGYRYQGLGREVQRLTFAQLQADANAQGFDAPIGICGEVARPELATSEAQRENRVTRVRIFEHLGARWLDVDYIEPTFIEGAVPVANESIDTLDPRRMMLYLAPLQPGLEITPELTAGLVRAVLIDNYRLEADSRHVQKILATIGRRDSVRS